MNELRELLAEQEHERWARWMSYLFTKGSFNPDGSFTISVDSVKHWQRQINTPYERLSKQEKDSDRKEADNTIRLLLEVNKSDMRKVRKDRLKGYYIDEE